MSGLRGILNDAGCFAKAAGSVDSINGWEAGLRDWAAFTTFCSFLQSWAEQEPYQAVIQPERMLSMMQVWKLVRVVVDMLNFISLLRK